jgi:hypothetical protein
MASDSDSGDRLRSKYEIAQQISYPAFSLDTPAKPSFEKQSTGQQITSESVKPHEEWNDANKAAAFTEEAKIAAVATADKKGEKKFVAGDIYRGVDRRAPREKRAVWIVHGMGEQIPFETVDTLTRGLIDAVNPGHLTRKPRLRTVNIGGLVVQRVELDVQGAQTDPRKPIPQYELHLYESYWAPKTEGVAKLTDVVSFLWQGGLHGLLNSRKEFQRAMFGGMGKFSISGFTPIWLCVTLLLLVSLTVINGVILSAAAARSGLPILNSLTGNWERLTALASCMTAVAFTFGTVLFIADMSKPQTLRSITRVFLGMVGWASAVITAADIVGTAALMAAVTYLKWTTSASDWTANLSCSWPGSIESCMASAPAHVSRIEKARGVVQHLFTSIPSAQLQGFATKVILGALLLVIAAVITRAILRSSETQLREYPLLLFFFSAMALGLNFIAIFGCLRIWKTHGAGHTTWELLQSPLWVWPFLILFSAKVRELMVQYVGDVAIYVTPAKLDRFDEVRSKIKEAARSVASAIFTAYEPNTTKFVYDHVAVVGHSLGSVIAYDTVNRLMLDDWLSGHALGIAERTKTMVTFGSPLNKTAFLFTIQGKDSLRIRERLACTVQPLIISYPKFRKLKWINVYSKNDIISGKLRFYDLPGFQEMRPEGFTGTWPPPEAVDNIIDKDAAVPLVAHVAYWKNKLVWNELLKQTAPGSVPADGLK